MKWAKRILLACVVLASGCVTDKRAVFEGNVLTDEEMKPYVGNYQLVAATEGDGKEMPPEKREHFTLELSRKDDTYFFVCGEWDRQSSGPFVLSKIPDAKANLLLFASPEVKSTGQHPMTIENVFFIMQREKDTVRVWLMLGDEPVVKDFPFTRDANRGGFSSKELQEFLKKHADEFVSKNPACLTFKKTG